MKYQSYCCQLCGTPIGWLGRLFQAVGGGFHKFECRSGSDPILLQETQK